MNNVFSKLKNLSKGGYGAGNYIKRWPTNPKVAFFGPPNVYMDEFAQRLAIDLGVPIVSVPQLMENCANKQGDNPDFQHPFFDKVGEMVRAGDKEALIAEKIPIKLLRLTPAAQEGMIMVDFPYEIDEAELLEEYRGGLNAFVHLSLPDEVLVDIEETKVYCPDSDKYYYKNDVVSEEHGVRINAFMPEDGFCYASGSTNFVPGSDPVRFERELEIYSQKKDALLSFYNDLGLLVDFEPRRGYEDYDKLKRQIQYMIKH